MRVTSPNFLSFRLKTCRLVSFNVFLLPLPLPFLSFQSVTLNFPKNFTHIFSSHHHLISLNQPTFFLFTFFAKKKLTFILLICLGWWRHDMKWHNSKIGTLSALFFEKMVEKICISFYPFFWFVSPSCRLSSSSPPFPTIIITYLSPIVSVSSGLVYMLFF